MKVNYFGQCARSITLSSRTSRNLQSRTFSAPPMMSVLSALSPECNSQFRCGQRSLRFAQTGKISRSDELLANPAVTIQVVTAD